MVLVGAGKLLTVTADPAEVVLLPALSVACAVMVWLPLPTLPESQVTLHGAWLAEPTAVPSTRNWTWLSWPGLEAAADSVTELPETMAAGAGAKTETTGGVAWLPSA